MRAAVTFVALVCLVGACSRSEEEIRAEFEAFVAAHNECAVTEECVLASTECPLGCAAAVNAKHKASVEQKARALVDEYNGLGRACANDCGFLTASCVEGRCKLVPQ